MGLLIVIHGVVVIVVHPMRHASQALLCFDLLFNIARCYLPDHSGSYLAFIMLEEFHVHYLLLVAPLSVDSAPCTGYVRQSKL